jgi:Helix-turn-helix domain
MRAGWAAETMAKLPFRPHQAKQEATQAPVLYEAAGPRVIGASQAQHRSAHLGEDELAARWQIAVRTLQRWRRAGDAPPHLLLRRRVLYRQSDVEAFEAARIIDGARS